MILIAIGSNLPHPDFGDPIDVCQAALEAVSRAECPVVGRSRWFYSAPVPASDQPDYVNGVIVVKTDLSPAELLKKMHEIEAEFGRHRSVPNAARVLDLDLIAYDDIVANGEIPPILPHPRMSERAFVLLPLLDVAPGWIHPVSGHSAAALVAALSDQQVCAPIVPGNGEQAI